jgi:predicted nucleotidyltransferase
MNQLIEQNRQNIRHLAEQRGIRNVRLFGSMSRDDAGPDSDVDLLVELEKGRSGLALGGFLEDVAELLGRHVDVVTEQALHPRIRDRVLHEAQPL